MTDPLYCERCAASVRLLDAVIVRRVQGERVMLVMACPTCAAPLLTWREAVARGLVSA